MAKVSEVNKKLIKSWIKELRSGRYKQCKRKLTDGMSYCCLGVLCHTNGLTLSKEDSTNSRYFYHWKDEISADLLPSKFRDCINFSNSQQRDLSTMNDEGLDFEAIAEYLELRYVLETSTVEWVKKYNWEKPLFGEING